MYRIRFILRTSYIFLMIVKKQFQVTQQKNIDQQIYWARVLQKKNSFIFMHQIREGLGERQNVIWQNEIAHLIIHIFNQLFKMSACVLITATIFNFILSNVTVSLIVFTHSNRPDNLPIMIIGVFVFAFLLLQTSSFILLLIRIQSFQLKEKDSRVKELIKIQQIVYTMLTLIVSILRATLLNLSLKMENPSIFLCSSEILLQINSFSNYFFRINTISNRLKIFQLLSIFTYAIVYLLFIQNNFPFLFLLFATFFFIIIQNGQYNLNFILPRASQFYQDQLTLSFHSIEGAIPNSQQSIISKVKDNSLISNIREKSIRLLHIQKKQEEIEFSGNENLDEKNNPGKSLKSFNDCRSSKYAKVKDEFEFLGSFRKILRNNHLGFALIDENCKVYALNQKLQEIMGTSEKQQIQLYLSNLEILKLDKKTSEKIQLKKQNNSFADFSRSQSDKVSIYSGYQLIKTVEAITLIDLLKKYSKVFPMWAKSSQNLSILEFKCPQLDDTWLIDIYPEDGFQPKKYQNSYVIVFNNVNEYTTKIIKKTTYQLMHQLFRSFSHEFSTSLNVIQMLIQAGQNEDALPKRFNETYLVPVYRSCQILNSITQDIRDFNMMLSKTFQLNCTQINITIIINRVIELFLEQIKIKNLELLMQVDKPHLISSDPQRLFQVILNLLSNAQKYTEKGYIKIKVEEVIIDQKYLKISIEDSGVGMNNYQIERISQFLNGEARDISQNSTVQSFGIGLMISNFIAMKLSKLKRNNGGGIQFSSVQGQGSVFSLLVLDNQIDTLERKFQIGNTPKKNSAPLKFSLYALHQDRSFKQPHKSSQFKKFDTEQVNNNESSGDLSSDKEQNIYVQPIKTITRHKSINLKITKKCDCSKILIVDDEYLNIYALTILLKNLNQQADRAFNGEEGVLKVVERIKKLCNACQIGYLVVFMDVEMPILNGINACSKIKQFCEIENIKSPYIIAQTAYVDKQTQLQCESAGMDYFLCKPISKESLKIALQKAQLIE